MYGMMLIHQYGIFILFILFYLFFYLRECEQERGAEGERESQAGSTLSAEPNVGHDPLTLGSQPELKSRVGHSPEPPRCPSI